MKIGKQPTKSQWIEDSSTPSDMPIRTVFGGWESFLLEMNLKPIKYIPTKNGKTRAGVRNKERKKIINSNGYIEVFEPDHPVAMSNGYCLEHRMVAFDNGALKNLDDIVHHKDENKLNNNAENLKVMSNSKHTSLHCLGVSKSKINKKECSFIGCKEITSSKYQLCRKHYKLQ